VLALWALWLQAGPAAARAPAHKKHKRAHARVHKRAPAPADTSSGAPEEKEIGDTGVEATHAVGARRVLVLPFRGPGAAPARAASMQALGAEPTVALEPLGPLWAERGGGRHAGKGKGKGKDKDKDKDKEILAGALKLELTALVRGSVKKVGRNLRATLTVLNGSDGQVIDEVTIQGRGPRALRTNLRAQLWAKLGPLIERASSAGSGSEGSPVAKVAKEERAPAAEPGAGAGDRPEKAVAEGGSAPPADQQPAVVPAAPNADGEAPGEESSAPPGPRTRTRPSAGAPALVEPAPAATTPRGCAALELELGGGVFLRRFNYTDEQRGALRAYNLQRAPVGLGELTFYPFALDSCGAASAIGVRVGYEYMRPLTSHLEDRPLPTTASAYHGELVLRIRLGALTLKPSAGYFGRSYTVDGDVVPSVAYRSVGGGLEAGLKLGVLLIELGAGGRWVLDAGQLQSASWFPQATGLAATGRARLGLALGPRIDLLATVDAEYYSFRFNIVAGGAYPNGVASGAYDIYLHGLLALRFHLF
jgi:hypothetical protein